MGLAYQNIGDIFYNKGIMCVNGKLFNSEDRSDFPVKKYFESGDELWVHSNGLLPPDPGCAVLHPDISRTSKKVWVMDAAKGIDKSNGLYLIDGAGVPYTGVIDSLKIIRSGKRNMPQASAGSIVSLANPTREVTTGNFRIIIDSNTQVIHTAATAYKDFWKVENSMYQKDTVVTVYDTTTVFPTITVTNFRKRVRHLVPEDLGGYQVTQGSANIISSFEGVRGSACASIELYGKSILYFDTSAIPQGTNIISATLSLSPRIPLSYWPVMKMTRRPCVTYYSYNYMNANNYYMGSRQATLGRIASAWNYSTPYTSFNVSNLNTVNLDYNNFLSLDCSSLLQDMIDNHTKYGMMLDLSYQVNGVNYLNFCSKHELNINNINGSNCGDLGLNIPPPSYRSGPSVNNDVNDISTISCDCQQPVLTVTYRYPVDTTIQVCRPNIVDSATNPYRWGILGNWRVDRAYSYYSDRKESDASITQTNIRKEGTLKNFTTFWQMTDSVLLPNPDTTKWVWNSALSMYNRKGFEIENYDPLGRYNSGLYGYNETLPVAVAQNSKYRQMLFDGFEDYNYKAQNCVLCASPREFDFATGNSNVSVTDTLSHTGLYSLKVNKGHASSLTVPVSVDTLLPYIQFKIDSSAITTTTITGKGTGVSGSYYGHRGGQYTCGVDTTIKTVDTTIDFMWGSSPRFGTMCPSYNGVTWNGFIQAPSTGNFTFYANSDYQVFAKINNQNLFANSTGNLQSVPIPMIAGQLYPITVRYTHFLSSMSSVHLYWSSPTMSRRIVPKLLLYPQNKTTADTSGSVISTVVKYCIKARYDTVQNIIKQTFSPIRGDHMVLTGWIRIDAADCGTLPALTNVINVSFDVGGSTGVTLQPTGVRIEDWQRYESEVFVPANAATMTISITAPSANSIFLDDIKMQPFNSSMKGFVYNPVNLRLMAELDENNYASFYEYDDDGTLIRVKKETERGIKTIQETRSALIKDN